MRNFRKYDVWIDGIEFVVRTYSITAHFPSKEQFGLTAQRRRSAVSISSNIAEGASRKSFQEFSRFIEIAIGSSFELETQLIISHRQQYLPQETLDDLLEMLHSIQRRLNALRTTLQK